MSITGEGTAQRSGRGRFGTADNDSKSRRSDRERGVQHGGYLQTICTLGRT